MRIKASLFILILPVTALLFMAMSLPGKNIINHKNEPVSGHYLYVAVPGIRDYMGYGGHGLLIFDLAHGQRFVKRIEARGLHPNGKPSNVKGIAVSIPLNSIYISTLETLQRIDLSSGKIIWKKAIEDGFDRM